MLRELGRYLDHILYSLWLVYRRSCNFPDSTLAESISGCVLRVDLSSWFRVSIYKTIATTAAGSLVNVSIVRILVSTVAFVPYKRKPSRSKAHRKHMGPRRISSH